MQHEFHLASGPICLRPLEPADADLLFTWLTDPHVLEYWEGPSTVYTPQRVQKDFYEDEWNASRCIVGYQGKDIGYVQVYQLDDEGFWGKGVGRAFIRLLTEELRAHRGAHSVVLDPHTDNLRAIRCYEACGFRKVKLLPQHELHDGKKVDCWLMALVFPKEEG